VTRKRRWFQATFRNNPFSDRHARPERGRQTRLKSAPLLPATAFGPRRISAPDRFQLPHLSGACASQRRFARPRRLPPFEGLHYGVDVPHLLLQLNSELLSGSFEPRLPASFRLRVYGADHRHDSVAGLAARNSLSVSGSHSPPGLASFGVTVLTTSGLGGSPSLAARLPFAPRQRSFFIIPACGSSFAARCRSRGLLFLLTSWNHPDNAPKRVLSQ
jgi:hypothetical protein